MSAPALSQAVPSSALPAQALSGWPEELRAELRKEYMVRLRAFIAQELARGKQIYPHGKNIFAALECTPYDSVRAVILGQDPYHGPGQAHGMCFSVRPGVAVPPSLVNIYKELKADLGIQPPPHGYLMHWAREGVLLLNSVLTVERGKAGSHHGKGWEAFTDKVIELLASRNQPMAFLLWGTPAQKKAAIVDPKRHLVLRAPHPSPLSAHRGFLGCRHFSKCNQWLEKQGLKPIDWKLPDVALG